MRVELHVTSGPAMGRHFHFNKPDCFLFGRANDAHISLPKDLYVSRQHFFLEISPPLCKLRDLHSKNGVFVNGVRYGGRVPLPKGIKQAPINEVLLKNGDKIIVGGHLHHGFHRSRQGNSRNCLLRRTYPLQFVQKRRLSGDSGIETRIITEVCLSRLPGKNRHLPWNHPEKNVPNLFRYLVDQQAVIKVPPDRRFSDRRKNRTGDDGVSL